MASHFPDLHSDKVIMHDKFFAHCSEICTDSGFAKKYWFDSKAAKRYFLSSNVFSIDCKAEFDHLLRDYGIIVHGRLRPNEGKIFQKISTLVNDPKHRAILEEYFNTSTINEPHRVSVLLAAATVNYFVRKRMIVMLATLNDSAVDDKNNW
jgi:hypothetical protein